MRRQLGFADLLEPEVIGIFHEDVHVVVPGDEAFMPHRSKSGSKSKEIRDIVLFADPVHLFEQIQFAKLQSAEIKFTHRCYILQLVYSFSLKPDDNRFRRILEIKFLNSISFFTKMVKLS